MKKLFSKIKYFLFPATRLVAFTDLDGNVYFEKFKFKNPPPKYYYFNLPHGRFKASLVSFSIDQYKTECYCEEWNKNRILSHNDLITNALTYYKKRI